MRGAALALMLAAGALSARECELKTLEWTAFKTPLKTGVSGTFERIAYIPAKESCLEGSRAIINKHSVTTGNAARDKTLDMAFFSKLPGDITAKIEAVKKDRLDVAITLGGITKIVPFHYKKEGDTHKAHGVIDLLDFAADDALRSINRACYDLHEGKTWSDVELRFEIKEGGAKPAGEREMHKSML